MGRVAEVCCTSILGGKTLKSKAQRSLFELYEHRLQLYVHALYVFDLTFDGSRLPLKSAISIFITPSSHVAAVYQLLAKRLS